MMYLKRAFSAWMAVCSWVRSRLKTPEIEVPVISQSDLQHLLRCASTPPQLIDVRGATAYKSSRIPGALHLPLDEIERAPYVADQRVPTIVYCVRGITSEQAARYLMTVGFESVWHLEGGFSAWTGEVENEFSPLVRK